MNSKKQISLILQQDINQNKIGKLQPAKRQKDQNHLQRRQQQRAINNDMIKITLLYGRKHYNKGAIIFTLTDRTLSKTPYFPFKDVLRGLRVVCLNGLPNPQILTAYWHTHTKHNLKNSKKRPLLTSF
ncbi:hypothetical protein PCC7424_2637 [Gloeothece citriformis PCC 7424]|uniref:Uncharacterized protein n=1 Tax=Gloeothece citriformis (strain PCC 7424) TaxID=65393 RepID=B7KKT2_GLOC7|nr:hypothetical protein [Gloeothece citriformis]ACK71051.1 hypothetical protein PCC7424_2637 [Gloeothece citriformis PCC 7424]